MRKAGVALTSCANRVGSIAASIDDRDSSMKSIVSQLMRVKTQAYGVSGKISVLESAVYHISGEYESVEKRNYATLSE